MSVHAPGGIVGSTQGRGTWVEGRSRLPCSGGVLFAEGSEVPGSPSRREGGRALLGVRAPPKLGVPAPEDGGTTGALPPRHRSTGWTEEQGTGGPDWFGTRDETRFPRVSVSTTRPAQRATDRHVLWDRRPRADLRPGTLGLSPTPPTCPQSVVGPPRRVSGPSSGVEPIVSDRFTSGTPGLTTDLVDGPSLGRPRPGPVAPVRGAWDESWAGADFRGVSVPAERSPFPSHGSGPHWHTCRTASDPTPGTWSDRSGLGSSPLPPGTDDLLGSVQVDGSRWVGAR